MLNTKFTLVVFALIVVIQASFAQVTVIDSFLTYHDRNNAKKSFLEYVEVETDANKRLVAQSVMLLGFKEIDSAWAVLQEVDILALSPIDKAYYDRSLSKIYSKSNFEDDALARLLKSKKGFERLGMHREANRLSYDIIYLLISHEHLNLHRQNLLEEFREKSVELKDSVALFNLNHLEAAIKSDSIHKKYYFKKMRKAKVLSKIFKDSSALELCHSYMGHFYANYTNQIDSAKYHLNKSLYLAENYGSNDHLFSALRNRAVVPRIMGDYQSSLKFMHYADTVPIIEFEKNNKRELYFWMYSDYYNLKKLDSALLYLEKYVTYTNSIQIQSQNRNLSILNTREIQLEKQLETEKRMLNRSLLIAALGGLVLLGSIALTNSRSQRRKKRIVERENELLLKNQELTSIDSMVAGQAKERQRLAEDLHDNLGGLLATLKLYIQNFKVKTDRLDAERDMLLKRTDEILEMAYQKVRSLAHERNSGNPISLGLIPVIKEYAAQVSGAHKLVIEVLDHGDDKRIGNLAELTLFRIVQELITNVIKHASAKEVTIDFTYYEDNLSIVFEDNGEGFDQSRVKIKKDGMGLDSIKRRVAQLEGTYDIDSKLGKGTTIILNIPL